MHACIRSRKYMNTLIAFLRKDFLIAWSYKLPFLLSIAFIFLNILVFFYFSRFIDGGDNIYLNTENYFTFVILGIAVADMSNTLLSKISIEIRNYQLIGVFENLILASSNPYKLFLSSYAYPLIFSLVKILIYLYISVVYFGANFQILENFIVFSSGLVLTFISISGVGMIAGAYTILFKQGNPIMQLYLLLSSSIGGIFFPQSVFPKVIDSFANFLPIRHSLDILRGMSSQANEIELHNSLLWLICLSIVYFLLGFFLLKFSINYAKKNGSLLYY